MNIVLKALLVLNGIMFIGLGLGFMIAPAQVVDALGMPLLDGLGRSTQLGDLAGFFTAGGVMILLGIKQENATWFYGAAMLVGFTAVYRTLAWALHDAALAVPQIGLEIVLTVLMLMAASAVAKQTRG